MSNSSRIPFQIASLHAQMWVSPEGYTGDRELYARRAIGALGRSLWPEYFRDERFLDWVVQENPRHSAQRTDEALRVLGDPPEAVKRSIFKTLSQAVVATLQMSTKVHEEFLEQQLEVLSTVATRWGLTTEFTEFFAQHAAADALDAIVGARTVGDVHAAVDDARVDRTPPQAKTDEMHEAEIDRSEELAAALLQQPGVGRTAIDRLFVAGGGFEGACRILEAGPDEIAKLKGVGAKKAEAIADAYLAVAERLGRPAVSVGGNASASDSKSSRSTTDGKQPVDPRGSSDSRSKSDESESEANFGTVLMAWQISVERHEVEWTDDPETRKLKVIVAVAYIGFIQKYLRSWPDPEASDGGPDDHPELVRGADLAQMIAEWGGAADSIAASVLLIPAVAAITRLRQPSGPGLYERAIERCATEESPFSQPTQRFALALDLDRIIAMFFQDSLMALQKRFPGEDADSIVGEEARGPFIQLMERRAAAESAVLDYILRAKIAPADVDTEAVSKLVDGCLPEVQELYRRRWLKGMSSEPDPPSAGDNEEAGSGCISSLLAFVGLTASILSFVV